MPEEAEALTVPRAILREPGSATVIEAVEIYAPVLPKAVTPAQQMIHQIRQSSLAAPCVTSEHIFGIEYAIQEAGGTNPQLAISWLDISNAFGTVSHDVLFSLLDRYVLDPTFTSFIKNLYKNATIVKGANGTNVIARWSVGVRQDLPSLPCEAETTAVNVFGQPITALAYADDIALFAPSIGVMQQQLCKIQGMASAMGFRFNPKKCASLYLNQCGRGLEAIDRVVPRSSDSRVAASMPCEKTPALKSGRRRSKEVTDGGQTERMERRRGSRESASATDLGMRMVTRGRKKLMEALVREAVHHE
ncbi:hypothetical protein T06_5667 [Trichinella sp. T6]|nr:hypothetical protein T06_5667 [Trichinella sp. T6]